MALCIVAGRDALPILPCIMPDRLQSYIRHKTNFILCSNFSSSANRAGPRSAPSDRAPGAPLRHTCAP
ncbi:hypothetical protein CBM2592_A220065 [Cupriavidus taiwanensis]|nr:hypothetical protein CBM2592_A220065 [Cupriavidus taiwanensis]SOZ79521.1 hypothetical protein CBM2618_A220064 [Cupriavidus taiwanensis]SPA14727.1 hypothetical protein CBM2631_A250064 [Cupriavidus taiwanensis]SPD44273.1 protein of unknown function [Cupriavidus taiwanensis]